MTKLPETISKRINVVTGEEVPLGCVDPHYPRASGRTTAIALQLIASALARKVAVSSDHLDYETAVTHNAADNLKHEVLGCIEQLGLRGFTVSVIPLSKYMGFRRGDVTMLSPDNLCADSKAYGVEVKLNLYKEVHYDLRK